MSERAKVGFTKGANKNTYVSEEVDGYLVMLHGAYEEMEEELKSLKTESDKDKELFAKEKEQLKGELTQARQTIEGLEKAVNKVPNIESMREFYENQIESLKATVSTTQDAQAELRDENVKLKEDIEEHLKTVEDLKKTNADMKSISEVEEFYEEKVKGLEELVGRSKEEIHVLRIENETILEAKRCLEEEQLKYTSDGRARVYGELFERSANEAQGYVDDTRFKMDAMVSEAKEKQDGLLHQAQVSAFNIVREAKIKSDDLIEHAQRKSQSVLDEAKDEYNKIRELIEKASREYVAIATLKHKTESMDVLNESLELTKDLPTEGI